MQNYQDILKKLNFSQYTKIQENVIDIFDFNKKNLVIISKTGTGKTYSYLVPIYKNLNTKNNEKVLIFSPTNELALQVNLVSKTLFLEEGVVFLDGREKNLKEKNVIIGSPSKIFNQIKQNNIKLEDVKYLVFDEADMMFELDFMDQILPIVESVKTNTRLLLVSASISQTFKPFINKYFGNYLLITDKDTKIKIKYYLLKTEKHDRLNKLKDLLKFINPYLLIIFVSKKDDINLVYQELYNQGLNVCKYSADTNFRERKQLFQEILKNKYQYIVTSDVSSRGIDFEASHIINYDLPRQNEYFIHRAGRTARNKKDGIVYTLYTLEESRKIDNYKKKNINFIDIKIGKDKIEEIQKTSKNKHEIFEKALKSVKKPDKVKPNYKKKNKEKIQKRLKEEIKKQGAQTFRKLKKEQGKKKWNLN